MQLSLLHYSTVPSRSQMLFVTRRPCRQMFSAEIAFSSDLSLNSFPIIRQLRICPYSLELIIVSCLVESKSWLLLLYNEKLTWQFQLSLGPIPKKIRRLLMSPHICRFHPPINVHLNRESSEQWECTLPLRVYSNPAGYKPLKVKIFQDCEFYFPKRFSPTCRSGGGTHASQVRKNLLSNQQPLQQFNQFYYFPFFLPGIGPLNFML